MTLTPVHHAPFTYPFLLHTDDLDHHAPFAFTFLPLTDTTLTHDHHAAVTFTLTISQRLRPLGCHTCILDHNGVHALLGVNAMPSIGTASALWAVGIRGRRLGGQDVLQISRSGCPWSLRKGLTPIQAKLIETFGGELSECSTATACRNTKLVPLQNNIHCKLLKANP